MLSEINAATESGRFIGQIFVWVALLVGDLKCWSISRRPATNTKCALSLMIVFLAMLIAGGIGAMIRVLGTTPGLAVLEGILGLGMLAALVTAIVLAILGLIEFSNQGDVYTQGKAQAIWTLVLAVVMCVIAGTGYVK